MLRPASKLTGAFCHQSTKSRLNFNDKSIVLCPYPFLWPLSISMNFFLTKLHVKAQSITRCLFGHLRKFDVQQKVGGWKCFIFYLLQLCFVHICYSIFSYLLTCHVLFLFCQIITKTKNVLGTITSVVLHKHTVLNDRLNWFSSKEKDNRNWHAHLFEPFVRLLSVYRSCHSPCKLDFYRILYLERFTTKIASGFAGFKLIELIVGFVYFVQTVY